VKALKTMVREHSVDYVFAEPSGIVIPFELRNTIAAAGRDVRITSGPVVMLLNAADPQAPFEDHIAHVTRQQIGQSDQLVIAKIDIAQEDSIETLEHVAREAAPTTPLHRLSLAEGHGVAGLVDAVLGPAAQ
jgi:G3E family GTPase